MCTTITTETCGKVKSDIFVLIRALTLFIRFYFILFSDGIDCTVRTLFEYILNKLNNLKKCF